MKRFLCLLLVGLARTSPVIVPEVHVPKAPVAVVTGVEPNPLTYSPKVDPVVIPAAPKSEVVAVVVPQAPINAPVVSVPAGVPPAPVVVPVAPHAVPAVAVAPEAAAVPAEPVPQSLGNAVVYPAEVAEAKAPADDVRGEKHSQDSALSEPIDKATKLVIDLDEHLKKYLPAEDEVAAITSAPHIYSGSEVAEAEADNKQQNPITGLIDQVNRLAESIENTITDLVARRRYVTAAMLRSMLNYVRRVRVNLERLQNRLQSVQAVATSGQNAPPAASAIPGASFFNPIRDRINRLTEEIGALVTRIRSSFTPGGVTVSPLPPLATAPPNEVSAAAASASIASAVGTINAAGPVGNSAASAAAVATSA